MSESSINGNVPRPPSSGKAGVMTAYTHPAAAVIQAALQRQGRSQAAALREAGIAPKTLANWLNNVNTPFRENVKDLADVLEAPELVTLFATKPKFLEITCRECGAVESRPTSRVTAKGSGANGSKRHFAIELDLAKGRGVWTCTSCSRADISDRVAWLGRYKTRQKKVGKAKALAELPAYHPTQTPKAREAWEDSKDARQRGLVNAVTARTGAKATRETRMKQAARRLQVFKPSSRMTFDYCRECYQLMWYQATAAAPKFALHRKCLDIFRARKGAAAPPPGRKAGNRLSSEELDQTYEFVIRHLFQGQKPEELAKGLSAKTVDLRITNFIKALPEDDRGGRVLFERAELLRWADSPAGERWLRAGPPRVQAS
jgi:lambda repressor-like predicted transcriptional regulator